MVLAAAGSAWCCLLGFFPQCCFQRLIWEHERSLGCDRCVWNGWKGGPGSSSLSIEVGSDLWQLSIKVCESSPPAGSAAFHHRQEMNGPGREKGRDCVCGHLKRIAKPPCISLLCLAALFIKQNPFAGNCTQESRKVEMLVASAALVSPFLALDLAWRSSGGVLLIFLLLLFRLHCLTYGAPGFLGLRFSVYWGSEYRMSNSKWHVQSVTTCSSCSSVKHPAGMAQWLRDRGQENCPACSALAQPYCAGHLACLRLRFLSGKWEVALCTVLFVWKTVELQPAVGLLQRALYSLRFTGGVLAKVEEWKKRSHVAERSCWYSDQRRWYFTP